MGDTTSTHDENLIDKMRQEAAAEKAQLLEEGIIPDEITPEVIIAALDENEMGDAFLLTALLKGRCVYDHLQDRWFSFNGVCWVEDEKKSILWTTQQVADFYDQEAVRQAELQAAADNKESAKRHERTLKSLRKRSKELKSLNRTKRVLEFARSGEAGLGISGEEWDRHPMLLACANGVIDLETGVLLQGKPEDYLRTACPTPWKGIDEPCPTWEDALNDMNQDPENVDFLRRMLGYSITGLTVENKILFMQGKGRNGKSTILATLSHVLGDFTWCIESSLFTEQRFQRDPNAPTPALLSIRGRRLVYASETGANASMNTEQLKRLSSADMITARALNVNKQIEFIPTHQLVLSTNHLPAAPAKADDYAIWDRMIVFPLPFSFIEDPKEDFEKKVDKYLLDKLKVEAPGILAWLVRGCLEWQAQGLKLTDSIIKTTQQYERGEDDLRDFIDEWCELGDNYEVQAKAFYEAYCAWFKDREPSRKPMSNKRFGAKMANRFDRTEDHMFRYYLGVRIRDEFLNFAQAHSSTSERD